MYFKATESLQRAFEKKIYCEDHIRKIDDYNCAYNGNIDYVITCITKSTLTLPRKCL